MSSSGPSKKRQLFQLNRMSSLFFFKVNSLVVIKEEVTIIEEDEFTLFRKELTLSESKHS
jgi:hypothetical protein